MVEPGENITLAAEVAGWVDEVVWLHNGHPVCLPSLPHLACSDLAEGPNIERR